MDKHNNNFNFLRLFAAFLVIFSHYFDVTGNENSEPIYKLLHGKTAASGIGLSMFFFISGYFITQSAYATNNTLRFLQKRIARIYPALFVVVLLTAFVIGPLFTNLTLTKYFTDTDTWQYLYTLTGLKIRHILPGVFTQSDFFVHGVNASLWTISLEIGLYLSLALFYSISFLRKHIIALSAVLVLTCFILTTLKADVDFFYIKYLNLCGIFYLGSFVSAASASLSKKQLAIVFFSLSLTFLVLFILKFKTDFLLFLVIGFCTYFVGFSSLIKIRLTTDISYGTYLFAFPIQQIIFQLTNFNTSIFLQLTLTLLLTIPIAMTSWYFIEKPSIIFNRKRIS